MAHQPASQALSRFTILDLSRVRAGPTAVRQLADWGADVIKIEMPAALEADGALGAARDTPDFRNLQRDKRSLTLNLKEPDGLAILKRMVAEADVVVENYRPDVKTRLGVDYDSLAAINPRIILASISGFGQDGPYRDRPGFDQIAQGMGGLMSVTGLPGQGPVRVGIPVADLTAGHFCAQAILIALLERESSGRGQWVQTSLLQAQIFMLDFQAARWLVAGEVPGQAGNNHPTMIPTGVFETADGHINVACAGQAIWERFADAIDAPELIERPEYLTAPERSANRDALNDEIAERIKRRPSREWIEHFTREGVPSGEINTIDQVFADPQVKHLGIAQSVDSPTEEPITLVGQPIVMSRTPSKLARPAPARGEHSDEILGALGLGADEIADLRRRGIV